MATATAARAAARAALRDLSRTVDRLETERQQTPLLTRLRQDPAGIFRAARLTPDSWQTKILRLPLFPPADVV